MTYRDEAHEAALADAIEAENMLHPLFHSAI